MVLVSSDIISALLQVKTRSFYMIKICLPLYTTSLAVRGNSVISHVVPLLAKSFLEKTHVKNRLNYQGMILHLTPSNTMYTMFHYLRCGVVPSAGQEVAALIYSY